MLAAVPAAASGVHLDVGADVDADLRIVATNVGDVAARDVRPVLVFHEASRGDPVALAPGARHEWRLPLPPPAGPGTYPVVGRVEWTDAHGGHGALPVVALATSPGEAPSRVRAIAEAGPVGRTGPVRLRLENPDVAPIAGRVFLALPAGLSTEPESVPARVPGGGAVVAPFVIESHGAPAGTYPAYAVFEYSAAGIHHAVVARVTVTVAGDAGIGWVRRMLVGLAAFAAALLIAALAWRAARRR